LHKLLSLVLLGILVVLTGCDQSSQNIETDYGNRYIISLGTSDAGDASGVDIRASEATVTAPDTVSYFVEGYTSEKNYTWTLNGSELPVQARAQESYVWERRGGEFVTVVFTQDDPRANVDPNSSTTNTLRVNSPDDNINAEEITIATQVPTIAGQISRLGNYSTLASLATSSEVASVLDGSGPYTLLAPPNEVLGGLSAGGHPEIPRHSGGRCFGGHLGWSDGLHPLRRPNAELQHQRRRFGERWSGKCCTDRRAV
jgi:hypothetical protein